MGSIAPSSLLQWEEFALGGAGNDDRVLGNFRLARAAGGGGEPCWEGSGELTAGGSLVFTAVRVRDPPRQ